MQALQAVLKAIEPVAESLSKDFEQCTPIVFVAEKLKVKPGHVVAASFGLSLLLILTGIASQFITAVVGFLYPAYMSFKALETKDEEDDAQWLTYWVVFVLMSFLDGLLGSFLSLIPLYYLAKLVFYVYLFYPKSRGAVVIYQNLLRPLLKKYEVQIDTTLEKVAEVEKTIESKLHHD